MEVVISIFACSRHLFTIISFWVSENMTFKCLSKLAVTHKLRQRLNTARTIRSGIHTYTRLAPTNRIQGDTRRNRMLNSLFTWTCRNTHPLHLHRPHQSHNQCHLDTQHRRCRNHIHPQLKQILLVYVVSYPDCRAK